MILLLAAAATTCLTSPDGILGANRRASLSGDPHAATITSTYAIQDSGLDGTATRIVDLETGNYRELSSLGPILGGGGFDGTTAWSRDLTGYYKPQIGGTSIPNAVSEAYRNANLWWRADRGGARIEPLGCDALRVTPKNGTAFEARFDPQSHLLASISQDTTYGNRVQIRFSRYALRHGRMTAEKITTITNGDESAPARETLISLTVSGHADAAQFAMPSTQPNDWEIASPGKVSLPFRLLNNHIIADVRVNGKGPFPFLFDTGGHEILTPSTLTALGLSANGQAAMGGGGEKTAVGGYIRIDRIDANGASINGPRMVVLDFSPLEVEGLQLGGMLGVGFFERFVVEIDYAAKRLTIYDPAKFGSKQKAAAGTPVAFDFYEHMPQVKGYFEGHSARFTIDTGSRSDVTLASPYVARLGIAAKHPQAPIVTDGWGVGGPTLARVIRAQMLSLGAVKACGPLAALSVAKHGTFSDAGLDGNVGSGLLKRFRVTLDYADRVMYLAPLAHPDDDTSLTDRTGMWVNSARQGLQVMDVRPGGPADAAGLAVGDIVTSVEGAPVSTRSLSQWRSAFKTVPVGASIGIAYVRDGKHRTVAIRPRDFVPSIDCATRR